MGWLAGLLLFAGGQIHLELRKSDLIDLITKCKVDLVVVGKCVDGSPISSKAPVGVAKREHQKDALCYLCASGICLLFQSSH